MHDQSRAALCGSFPVLNGCGNRNCDCSAVASLTLTMADARVATIEVGYEFPGSPLKRHCSFMRIGAAGTATVWSDGSASFTSVDGATETARIDVDSDPLYGRFVDKVAEQLEGGFADLPGIRDLEATMTVIWDAYAHGRQGRTGVHTQHR